MKTAERELTIDIDQWPMPRYELFKNHDYRIISANLPVFRNIKAGWVLAIGGVLINVLYVRRLLGVPLERI